MQRNPKTRTTTKPESGFSFDDYKFYDRMRKYDSIEFYRTFTEESTQNKHKIRKQLTELILQQVIPRVRKSTHQSIACLFRRS